ncbi:MAG TPA: hypothetical protein VNT50_03760 [Microbacterium sp.]|uniref:DAPG hydrolase family protein n=1 Tax=Microbacterium sp. TaxID=51671 RepID=UPI002BA548A2|nr:hypothetical protein [Microbacterium sp.]HWI30581.1 hypothetical protein [Microbacterium sp.]
MFSFDEALDPRPLPRETGWERQSDGSLLVCVRTDLRGVTGKMFDWWFGSRPGTREYRWWHPLDHQSSSWTGGERGAVVGSTHVIIEDMTELKGLPLRVQFVEPTSVLSADAYHRAVADGNVSVAIAGRTADGHDGAVDEDGNLLGGRMLHLGRDTEWGMVLRSRFLIGSDLAETHSPTEIEKLIDEGIGPNLVQHCYEEFTYLSRVLPAIYAAESGAHLTRIW